LPTMEVATSQTQQTVNNMCLRSKKRTLELFVGNQGARPADDEASLRKKLAAKVNDEYGPIKHLPPPPKPAAAPTKKSVQPSRESPKEEVIIAGTHKFPPRAGVALTQENAESVEPELETGQYQNLIQTLPVSKRRIQKTKLGHRCLSTIKRIGYYNWLTTAISFLQVSSVGYSKSMVSSQTRLASSLEVDESNQWTFRMGPFSHSRSHQSMVCNWIS